MPKTDADAWVVPCRFLPCKDTALNTSHLRRSLLALSVAATTATAHAAPAPDFNYDLSTGAYSSFGDVFNNATFTGTSTAYATVTIRSGASSSVYQTVEADENGNWTARRTWDPSHTYKLIFDQEALDGQTDTVDYGTFTAK